MDKIITRESDHWYSADGFPVTEVPRKTPKRVGPCPSCKAPLVTTVKGFTKCKSCSTRVDVTGFRTLTTKAPDIDSARDLTLFPSVTAAVKWHPMPRNLLDWYRNLWADATINAWEPGIMPEAWKAKMAALCDELEDAGKERGTYIHGCIQKHLDGIEFECDSIAERSCLEVEAWIDSKGLASRQSERHFCNPAEGCGGTIDFVGRYRDATRLIVDFKSKMNHGTFEKIKKYQKAYDDYVVQIAGYWSLTGGGNVDAYVAPISQQTGEACFISIPQDRLQWGAKAFRSNLKALMDWKDFRPQLAYAVGNWTPYEEIRKLCMESTVTK